MYMDGSIKESIDRSCGLLSSNMHAFICMSVHTHLSRSSRVGPLAAAAMVVRRREEGRSWREDRRPAAVLGCCFTSQAVEVGRDDEDDDDARYETQQQRRGRRRSMRFAMIEENPAGEKKKRRGGEEGGLRVRKGGRAVGCTGGCEIGLGAAARQKQQAYVPLPNWRPSLLSVVGIIRDTCVGGRDDCLKKFPRKRAPPHAVAACAPPPLHVSRGWIDHRVTEFGGQGGDQNHVCGRTQNMPAARESPKNNGPYGRGVCFLPKTSLAAPPVGVWRAFLFKHKRRQILHIVSLIVGWGLNCLWLPWLGLAWFGDSTEVPKNAQQAPCFCLP